MDIQDLNRRHNLKSDIYYRINMGLSSRLIKFELGVIYIEVTLSKKWNKNYNATAAEMAHYWKNEHQELSKALACKVFILDKRVELASIPSIEGETVVYQACKGIIFRKNYLN